MKFLLGFEVPDGTASFDGEGYLMSDLGIVIKELGSWIEFFGTPEGVATLNTTWVGNDTLGPVVPFKVVDDQSD